MGFANIGITHCLNCYSPLSINECGLCKDCEKKQKEYMTQRNIKEDMKILREQIQEFVDKYNVPVNLAYKDNLKVSLHITLNE